MPNVSFIMLTPTNSLHYGRDRPRRHKNRGLFSLLHFIVTFHKLIHLSKYILHFIVRLTGHNCFLMDSLLMNWSPRVRFSEMHWMELEVLRILSAYHMYHFSFECAAMSLWSRVWRCRACPVIDHRVVGSGMTRLSRCLGAKRSAFLDICHDFSGHKWQ